MIMRIEEAMIVDNRIKGFELDNYGALPSFHTDQVSNINLVIGENGTGKTFFLKALFSAVRSAEEYRRGDDIRSFSDILSEKLRWTFQVEKLGDMVARSSKENLSFDLVLGEQRISYRFTESASSRVNGIFLPGTGRDSNSVFIPAKEVLSLYNIILKSREIDQTFGFDDTYYDLAKALRIAPSRGKNYSAFSKSRKALTGIVDGKVDYDKNSGKWFYKNSRGQKFSIGATAEGIKKISIMDRLLANGYLNDQSIIFIDELESALHPDAICSFLDMIGTLAKNMGIQFFISSHSYFVIKKLSLIAMKARGLVTCISLGKDREPTICDLYDGMPDNSIIDASIRLYEQEIEEGL